jgi:hypothetical protein
VYALRLEQQDNPAKHGSQSFYHAIYFELCTNHVLSKDQCSQIGYILENRNLEVEVLSRALNRFIPEGKVQYIVSLAIRNNNEGAVFGTPAPTR